MPVDHKRINGPDDSVPYTLFSKIHRKSLREQMNEVISKNGIRSDNRKDTDVRKIFLKTGIVEQAKGSAYIEVNNTKLLTTVFEPREIPNRNDYSLMGEIYCEFKYAPFSCSKRRLHIQDAEEKEYSSMMKKALDSVVLKQEFPNFQIDIYTLVLQNDGSALSAAIMSAGVALGHAGIPMYDLITSATIGIQGDLKFVDPTLAEERICDVSIPAKKNEKVDHGVITLSYLVTHNQVSQFYQTGNISIERLAPSIDLLTETCNTLAPLIKKCLATHAMKCKTVEEE